MKGTISTISLSLLLSYPICSSGASTRGLRKEQVHAESIDIKICSGEAILPIIQDNPNFSKALGSLQSPEAAINEICNDHQRSLQEADVIPFSYVTARGRQFDKNYFDGGTEWNNGVGGKSKEAMASRIPAIADILKLQELEWPSYHVNFDDTNSCQLQTAMCCFTKAQDPNTGVVSNINHVAGSEDVANADVCMVHLDRSPQAGHVKNGKTYYSDGRSVEDNTKHAYCTAFSWSEDVNDPSTKYRANTLFHISMFEGYYKNNLVGGVPGAPMCGCVEQMPIVSNADCVKPIQARRLSVSKDNRLLIDASLDFVPCNDDALVSDDLSKIITGTTCDQAIDAELTEKNFKRGSAWWHADENKWFPVLGVKDIYHPEISAEEFKGAFEASPTKVIRRICTSCTPSHRDIYYKRKTDVPESLDLLNMLKDSFSSENNELGIDFEIYSKDKDGTIKNWQYCAYSTSHGFPFRCGPAGEVKQQWSSSTKNGSYAKHYAFYIEV